MSNRIYQKLQYHAEHRAHKVAFYLTGEKPAQYTYQELIKIIEGYRQYFAQIKIREQAIIACALNNGKALFELTVSAYATNRILLPLNLIAGDKNLQYVLGHAEPAVIFANLNEFSRIKELAPKKSVVVEVVEDSSPIKNQCLEAKNIANKLPPTKDPTSSLLMYTSGTTGNPKGVLLSATNLLAGGKNTTTAHQLNEQDVGLCVLPLYHINAQCVSLMSTLQAGSSLVIAPKFSVHSFFSLIEKYSVSWASVVPTMLVFLLNAQKNNSLLKGTEMVRSLRFIRSASAPLPMDIHHRIEQWLDIPIIETMGITEASAQILSNPMPPATRKIGSVGINYGNEVMLMDKNLSPVPLGKEGEICVRGDNVMAGYYKNPDATKETLQKGWLRTGDLARMDEEGYFYVSGRTKELIIKGGENIAPREIDEVLYKHPAVIEVAAFGAPCSNYGQKVEVCIKKEGSSKVNCEDIMTFCQAHIGKFKSPDAVHFVDELPKGPSGKIQRLKLYDMIYGAMPQLKKGNRP